MMHHGVCPNCQAAEVYHGLATEGEGLSAGSFNAVVEVLAGRHPRTLRVDTYVCARCGHVELRIADPHDLDQLAHADGWERIQPL
jgi:rubrerythrin